ncbi:MAG TPA: HAMP domain-containing sensor histidine kinase [Gaiellaceae bacterium]|nr:HAMP domain-containing sensor histidine kinase [Gaiellaceae bacterium]
MPPSASAVSNVVELPVHHEYDDLLVELARRNEALEDFAALVAHELKTPLQAALLADDPSKPLEEALDLVDELLEAAQDLPFDRPSAEVAEPLDQVARTLSGELEVTSDLTTTLPLAQGPLRVILRNLLSNAAAAGARRVHVSAARSPRSWRLVVDDDGVGLGLGEDRYSTGSGLGLSLSRRIAARFDGVLQLAARPSGGTRATLEFAEVLR